MMRAGADVPPNQSIYINNLNEKVKKEELKKSLYAVFSQFGRILDIIALKTLKLRGQAWVVFDDVTASTNALRQMQGFPFYDKPMKIQYARTKSDVVAKADGSFVPREKKKKGKDARKRAEKAAQQGAAAAPAMADVPAMAPGQMPGAPGRPADPSAAPGPPAPPNNLLFVQGLAPDVTQLMLQMLFQQFPGFNEVRMVDAKPGIAFVEFSDDMNATVALQGLQSFKITPTSGPMLITYARR